MPDQQSGRSWQLDDATDIARAHPYTFYKPSAEAIALLRPGNEVKVIFRFDSDDPNAPRAERMWVLLNRIEGDRFFGSLDNNPRHIKDLAAGDAIECESRHIIQVDIDDPVPDPTAPYWARCFVTNSVLKDGQRVGYLYREPPDHENDSGWRFSAGDEPDEYMDDPANCSYVALGAVLGKDDSFLDLLQTPAPCAFELDTETGMFSPMPPPAKE